MPVTVPPPDQDVPPLPPAEEFWTKYNKRLEFPFSTVGAVLLHVVVALVIVLILAQMKTDVPDRSNLPVVIAPIPGYDPDGSPGSGPEPREEPVGEDMIEPPPIPPEELPLLPEVRKIIEQELADPAGVALPDHKLADLTGIDQRLAQALARGDRTRGNGPGGIGPDGAVPQSFRWTLRFTTTSGRDYLYQLGVLRAQILVPLPPDNAKCLLFDDLTAAPPRGRIASDEDIQRLARQVRFSDRDPNSVRQVAGVLGLDVAPTIFYAFFPDDLRQDWAAKERAFRGADPKDIEETVLRVTVAGGQADVRVTHQKLRKK